MEANKDITIWVHKKNGRERRLNRRTVELLGKALTNEYYQVETPNRPTTNPPEVEALLKGATVIKQPAECCDKTECKKEDCCKDDYPQPEPDKLSVNDEPQEEYKPAIEKKKGGRPRRK